MTSDTLTTDLPHSIAELLAKVTNADDKKITNMQARNYMHKGVARRLIILLHSYVSVIQTAPKDRAAPLTYEEAVKLTGDMNLIYINIRGVLDN